MSLKLFTLISVVCLIYGRFLVTTYYHDDACQNAKSVIGVAQSKKCYSEGFDDYFDHNSTHFEWRNYRGIANCTGQFSASFGPLNSCTKQPWGFPIKVVAAEQPPMQGFSVAQLFGSLPTCRRSYSGRYNLFKGEFCSGGTRQGEPSVMVQRSDNIYIITGWNSGNCTGRIVTQSRVASAECFQHPLSPNTYASITHF
jgi:hypothetical protein